MGLRTNLGTVLHVGFAVEQERHNFVAALEAGQCEGCVSVRLYLCVYVRSLIEQETDGGRVAIHCSEHQRRNPQFRSGSRVDLCPVMKQQPDDVDVATAGGQRQRGIVRHVAVFAVGAVTQEHLDDFEPAPRAGQRQSSVLGSLRLRFSLSAMLQQGFDDSCWTSTPVRFGLREMDLRQQCSDQRAFMETFLKPYRNVPQ